KPRPRNSGTTAWPMLPVAPVTKSCIVPRYEASASRLFLTVGFTSFDTHHCRALSRLSIEPCVEDACPSSLEDRAVARTKVKPACSIGTGATANAVPAEAHPEPLAKDENLPFDFAVGRFQFRRTPEGVSGRQ